ncbi:MAG TPA: PAS domain S-box protein [Candidatus Limnocylindria bacterium]|nr:PAS domain S-box protein [Candidatus Limnocylindria bacterium]
MGKRPYCWLFSIFVAWWKGPVNNYDTFRETNGCGGGGIVSGGPAVEHAPSREGRPAPAERPLQASELSYRRLFEAAKDGILILDVEQGRIDDVNPFLMSLLGFSREEMVGKTVGELSPFKDLVANRAMFEKLQQHGYVRYEDLPMETRDGRSIAVEFVCNIYQAGVKQVIQCNVRDITERKDAEKSLWASEERYHSLFENMLDGLAYCRMCFEDGRPQDFIYLNVNGAFEVQTGLKNVVGKKVTEVIPGVRESSPEIFEIYGRVVSTRKPERFEIYLGALKVWLTISAYSAQDDCFVAVIKNITGRKRAEESLRLLASAVDQSKDSILITDAELNLPGPRILFVNPAFTQMTGYTAEEAIGKTPRILQGPLTDKAVLLRLRGNLERGESFTGEAINYRKDGKEFNLEWQIAPIRGFTGIITHFVATQHDVTERRKLEQQFRQSQKMEGIGQLAGGVAHDFNNILAVIQMHADLLTGSGSRNVTADAESVDQISMAVQRAAALTRQLLLFSSRERFQPRDLDLSESIIDTTRMLQRILGENIQLQLKLGSQPLGIHADAGMMNQVLLNLVVNARDAMPAGGRLVIQTSGVEFDDLVASETVEVRKGAFVCLSVSDNGCGISKDILPRIFEPFFTTKDVGKGTGLGLATVYGIVKQHKGWINVYSESGHGTTFRIYIPRLATNPEPKAAPQSLAAMRGGGETVLLVEDDSSLRFSIRMALSQLGYQVLETSTGGEALEVWKSEKHRIRLLLTDLLMPDGITGKALAQAVLRENPLLKVVYMSGYSADIAGKDLMLREGLNFLSKPFQARQLAQCIRDSLDTPGQVGAEAD